MGKAKEDCRKDSARPHADAKKNNAHNRKDAAKRKSVNSPLRNICSTSVTSVNEMTWPQHSPCVSPEMTCIYAVITALSNMELSNKGDVLQHFVKAAERTCLTAPSPSLLHLRIRC